MEKTFMEAMDFRHACKIFDETKKISDEDMRFILEAGRKSPSSFGQEGWKFLVITNEELRAKLKPFCWDQPQITTCSHLVIVLAAIEAVKPESGIPALRFARREMPQDKKDFYNKLYKDHLTVTKVLDSDENVYSWTARQTYIAAGNMMTAAAIKGIDSCPIEGFEKAKVEEVLGLDTKKFQLSMVLPFGYRINPQSTQMRLPFEEVIEFIK
ncbi:NAD(P)H-dependent oxidoreductase [Aliarcobacter butzleri]|uniref:NAD(P)H-flavin nitroreductase n=1 Tax=Aliarcobacter butzleri L351 TaxID=1447259 RepID=A0A837J795_9BACT|nr:NAD(P)H-dependent oxidoreductase [Aliarcobacter butzleri]KLE02629.1 NAD(P)H-flavin nitroreductase [Aliarcobacter butzleri L351]KLE13575.1 NAD(P)H-flavin nitroreductase [Aliarcobacter butzleri L350]MDN5046880.1 NAD(P)H-dependent oxidoreductase [Aliarcobacter butzleri]MDN5059625.1 NAD(P)H-dependent oxidoreductase [Aliarcobacter butzleri]MDN5110020.1 NAD(P)H-dependent oxidoreductase [Aliarcobacter butzleri]